ncbi:hypothetical protein PENSTE_c002G05298 [Penicillium steckii]|uniref:Uncharacterized protein n=1 Tax=Penicillium steckii TaxID=303698 RepID=A0A1V6TTX2_9EURO|nr:hypothetical protein PENSTE_c002G05298 [Penicillium steckii]
MAESIRNLLEAKMMKINPQTVDNEGDVVNLEYTHVLYPLVTMLETACQEMIQDIRLHQSCSVRHRSEYFIEPDNSSRVDVIILLETFENGYLDSTRYRDRSFSARETFELVQQQICNTFTTKSPIIADI